MKNKDLRSLLIRAMAAIETPADLTFDEQNHLLDDLQEVVDSLTEGGNPLQQNKLMNDGDSLPTRDMASDARRQKQWRK